MQLAGELHVGGQIAYVPQNPWVQNLSLKENILFGEPYEEEKYNATIDACSLRFDLGILPKVSLPSQPLPARPLNGPATSIRWSQENTHAPCHGFVLWVSFRVVSCRAMVQACACPILLVSIC